MKQRTIDLIFGKTGSGKSTLAKTLLKKFDRVVIVDALDEYDGLIFEDFPSLNNYYLNNEPENFVFLCRFTDDLDIDFLFKWIFEIGNLCLVCEEAEIYISPYAKQSSFLRLVRYGRHKQISIIGIARRPAELSLDFRSQVNRIISFKQTDPSDLAKMQTLGFSGLENLPEYEFIEIYF